VGYDAFTKHGDGEARHATSVGGMNKQSVPAPMLKGRAAVGGASREIRERLSKAGYHEGREIGSYTRKQSALNHAKQHEKVRRCSMAFGEIKPYSPRSLSSDQSWYYEGLKRARTSMLWRVREETPSRTALALIMQPGQGSSEKGAVRETILASPGEGRI